MSDPTTAGTYLDDIAPELARAAHNGTSFDPATRGHQERDQYARILAADYKALAKFATEGPTPEESIERLAQEFPRYRAGYCERYRARLSALSRCLSTMITGPARFPHARNAKANDAAEKRTTELIEFRERALQAIRAAIRPDTRPIMAGDDDALERLREKLAACVAEQERMKKANAAIRRHKGTVAQAAALVALGYAEPIAWKIIAPDFAGRVGFADYQLKNNNAEIRRLKQRIEQVETAQATPAQAYQGANARFEDSPSENRVRLFYPDKPDDATRGRLKAGGFRWTPSIGAWQAYRNPRAIDIAKREAGPAAPSGVLPHVPEDAPAPTEVQPYPRDGIDRSRYVYEGPNGTPRERTAYSPNERMRVSIGELVAPAAAETEKQSGVRCGCKVNALEADANVYACPCGSHCTDPACIAIAESRRNNGPVGHFIPPGGAAPTGELEGDLVAYGAKTDADRNMMGAGKCTPVDGVVSAEGNAA